MNLVRQTSIYFVANVVSAVFGLANVMIFTRLLRLRGWSGRCTPTARD